jgi:hypothetical protein
MVPDLHDRKVLKAASPCAAGHPSALGATLVLVGVIAPSVTEPAGQNIGHLA